MNNSMDGTIADAVFEEYSDDDELHIYDIHPDEPIKTSFRSYLKILIMTWIVNDDR